MVVRHRKKTRKYRGSKTHGYGSKKKHRGAGSRGGRGHAGSSKHKIHYYIKYEPDHFGKRGFKSIQQRFGEKPRIINLEKVDKMIKEGGEVIDLRDYTKVLGKGEITKPATLIVRAISESAKRKVEEAGGKVLIR